MENEGTRHILISRSEPGPGDGGRTGSWRVLRPVIDLGKCIPVKKKKMSCFICWLYCPDMAVTVKDGKMTGFDFDYCKGCGICALECPGKKGNKAIVMIEEGK